MSIKIGENPQITVAPRCPSCRSLNCATVRSKRVQVEHEGQPHVAQKQYRKCRKCGECFGCICVKERVSDLKPRKMQGWVSRS